MYQDYMFWRAQGFTARSAFLICKMGFLNYVIEIYGGEE